MKKILLIISFIISGMCYAFDNNSAQFPTAQMQSVNQISSCTSYQSNITPVGAQSISNLYSQAQIPSRPRREGVGGYPNDPYASPVGDPPILFMILIAGISVYFIEKRKTKIEEN